MRIWGLGFEGAGATLTVWTFCDGFGVWCGDFSFWCCGLMFRASKCWLQALILEINCHAEYGVEDFDRWCF